MNDPETSAGRLDRALTWLAVVLATAWLAWLQASFPGLYDLDSYFHVRAAEQLPTTGVSTSFPQATKSTWRDAYSDKDFLFHVLLVPFVADGDLVAGGKQAIVLCDFLVLAAFAWALGQLGARFGALWVVLLLATSPYYLTRLSSVRPHVLGLAFVTVEIALLYRNRWKTMLVVSALHVLAHSSFVLVPVLLAVRVAAGWLVREPFPGRLVLAVVVGLAGASLLHPYFPNNLTIVQQVIEIMGTVGLPGAAIPPEAFGSELRPITWQALWAQAPGWLPAVAGVAALLALRGRRGFGAAEVYLLLVGATALLLALRSRRFVDVLVVAALLLAARAWTRLAGGTSLAELVRSSPVRVLPVVAAFAALLVYAVPRAASVEEGFARQAYGDIFAPAVARLGELAAPDDVVYHVSWMDFAVLYGFRPEGRYISGLDPIFLYRHDPALFAKNLQLARGRVRRTATAGIIANDFGARWVFVTQQPRDRPFRALLARSAGLRLVYQDPAAQIWRVQTP